MSSEDIDYEKVKLIKRSKELIKKGYSIIPVNSSKEPSIRTWSVDKPMNLEEASKIFNKYSYGLAVLMGGPRGLTGLDFDLKYSFQPEKLYEDFQKMIPESIRSKMYVQSTRNGGYHWIWSCPSQRSGNMKLAQRLTTPEEKDAIYHENYRNPVTRATALKIALNYKVKVIIETRGEGGYVLFAPTPGYKHVGGGIGELTLAEHNFVLDTARSFNEYFEPSNTNKGIFKGDGVNPFNEFDERGDPLGLLLNHGWKVVQENNRTVRLKRPGDDSSSSSALFDRNTKVLNVFTTSTLFDNGKGYSPASVFTILESNADPAQAYKDLCELGYNEKIEE